MITDRYNNSYFKDDSIVIIDADLDYYYTKYDKRPESTRVMKPSNYDRLVFRDAAEVDIGSGADGVVVILEVISSYINFGVTLSLFFMGERIERQAAAWARMYSKLMKIMGPTRKTNANGAALIALHEVSKKTASDSLYLTAYSHRDEEALAHEEEDPQAISFQTIRAAEFIEGRDVAYKMGTFSDPVFLFKISDGESVFLARVAGSECFVKKYES